jgi:MerR family transcriptional regulator/heat shock protein HspR
MKDDDKFGQKEFWTLTEVIKFFVVDEDFLRNLEVEKILCPTCAEKGKIFSAEELEKVRLAKILIEDMDINLPGVEVILRMRQNMFEMRKQFDTILEDIMQHFKRIIDNNPNR